MATTTNTDIQQLYVAYFNRPADPNGLKFWADNVAAGNATLAQVATAFSAQAEYTAEYKDMTNAEIVGQVYQNLFGRAGEKDGIDFWVGKLEAGVVTIADVVVAIRDGAQGSDKVAFNNKVTAAGAFTAALDTDAEIAGYKGDDANAIAKKFLSSVTDDASLAAAITPASLNGTVATAVAAGTEFSVSGALASLDAASKAMADFVDSVDADSADEIDAAATAAVGKVAGDLTATGAAGLFNSTTSASVRDALIADQQATNAKALTAAQKVLTDAKADVAEVAGLSAAQTTLTSATAAQTASVKAATTAAADIAAKQASFQITNEGAITINGDVTHATSVSFADADGNVTVLADISATTHKATLAEDVDAADYAGLTEMIASYNTYVNAVTNVDKANANVFNAQLAVNLLDVAADDAGSFTVGAHTYANEAELIKAIADQINATTKDTVAEDATPTVAQINTELAVLKAADTGSSTVYEDFQALVQAEGAGVSDELAAAQGTLDAAKDALDLAKTAATGTQDALDAAEEAFGAATNHDGVVSVSGTKLVFTPDGGTAVTLANIDATTHHAVMVAGIDTTYADVQDLLDAFDADADADVVVTTKTGDVTAAKNAVTAADVLNPLASAQTEATAGVKAVTDAIAKLTKDVAAMHTAQADAETLAGYQATYDAAAKVLEDNGYAVLKMDVDHAGSQFAGADSDIFVVDGNDAQISAFGLQGSDSVFVGTGYTIVEGAIGDKNVKGNDAVKEIFLSTDVNGDAQLQIETHAYSSAVKGGTGEIVTITLVGVDASTLHLSTDGIISAGTPTA